LSFHAIKIKIIFDNLQDMSNGKAGKKVPGGKLVRVDIEYSGDLIDSVRITGDFFLYPEDVLEKIEFSLQGKKLDEVVSTVDSVLSGNGATLVGVTSEDIFSILKEAMV